jgi:hypothetical protein
MKSRFLFCLVSSFFLSPVHQLLGQTTSGASPGAGYIAWFEVLDDVLQVRTGMQGKPLTKDVTLPNDTRLDHKAHTASLPDGKKVVLREGDLVDFNGNVRLAPAPAPPPASVAAPPDPGS